MRDSRKVAKLWGADASVKNIDAIELSQSIFRFGKRDLSPLFISPPADMSVQVKDNEGRG
jgi:hypothetical protein